MAPIQFATITSREYLPYARALDASIRRTNPASTLWVLLVDDLDGEVDPTDEPFATVRNEDLGLPIEELHRMYLLHLGAFLAAIKPWFLEHLVRTTGAPVLYTDSDIQFYGDISDIGELISEHGVVLFPHMLAPLPLDGAFPDDTTILAAGTFNAGMIGVGPSDEGLMAFLQSRLARECRVSVTEQRVNEQRWLDFAPSFVRHHVLRDRGMDVAYWNLHERPLGRTADRTITAGGDPLRSFHFSGYDLAQPSVLSKHIGEPARFTFDGQLILAELADAYRKAVLGCGFLEARGTPLGFNHLPGGLPTDTVMGTLYRNAVLTAEATGGSYPPDGYDLTQRPAFLAWLEQAQRAAGVAVASAAAAPTGPTTEALAEMLSRLAASSSAAVGNLDERLRSLEQRLGTLDTALAAATA